LGLQESVVQHCVATASEGAAGKRDLVGEAAGRVVFLLDQVMDKLLTHTFFRRQADVLFPQAVKDVFLVVPAANSGAGREKKAIGRVHSGLFL
jgi:hypothetical protein